MDVSTVTMKLVYFFIGFICLEKFQRLKSLFSAGISRRQMIFVLHFPLFLYDLRCRVLGAWFSFLGDCCSPLLVVLINCHVPCWPNRQ